LSRRSFSRDGSFSEGGSGVEWTNYFIFLSQNRPILHYIVRTEILRDFFEV